MVTNRLGWTDADVEDVRQALGEVNAFGYDAFVNQTYREVATAVTAARAGGLPTPEILRRAEVRKRGVVGLTELLELRMGLAQHAGPTH